MTELEERIQIAERMAVPFAKAFATFLVELHKGGLLKELLYDHAASNELPASK
jgi:hypothetical protein